ncbi:MAG: aspartate aminotransferase family protein [Endomicrobia bacterium]|nr:aspartate aminotransferase family protein [Endomicrobiia bacterium]MCX7940177.1 aspartate aminotransferase family protein [Endomicrobiia bacterium]MDW8055698.1 aspartate aminotransferase family protein [Elusimicrobiota bacterium]
MVSKFEQYFLKTYKKYNITFVSGKGKYLYDVNGKKYLDFFSGLSVTNLGHCDKNLIKVLKKQIDTLWHCSNLYYSQPQVVLAKEIIKRTFPSKVFFSNSGAEANECAIKLARKYGSKTGRYEIITFENSFHGRTLATLTATAQDKFHKGFGPLPKGFKYAKFNNISSVKRLINKNTVAVMLEPIQGEGGVIPADKNFLCELHKLCDKHDILLIFDEIQTGFGRTGKLFAFQHYDVKPDVITLAKSVANGIPLGVTVVDKKYEDVFNYGDHGSTFGGNLLACVVAAEVIKMIDNKTFLEKVQDVGQYFYQCLCKLKDEYDFIKDVRGIGLMLGVELTFPARNIVEECLKHGLVINVTQEKVLRFLPPLIITKNDVDTAIKILVKVFSKCKK